MTLVKAGSFRDLHYTPPAIAADVASAVDLAGAARVADFAVGNGVLLRAVRARAPDSQLAGTDVCAQTIRKLRSVEPDWLLGACDFLAPRSRSRCRVTSSGATFDVAVLNPPFSYRGGQRYDVDLRGSRQTGSPAASFVALATRYARQVVALLPANTLESERDMTLWRELERDWEILRLTEYPRGAFPGVSAKGVLVRLSTKRTTGERPDDREKSKVVRSRRVRVQLVRGCTPIHRAALNPRGGRLLHTTGLGREGMTFLRTRALPGRVIRGPAVVLPRVGAPVAWKVHTYLSPLPITLSDCVFGLVCSSSSEALEVERRIKYAWDGFQTVWTGSCAPYTTVSRLRDALARIDIEASKP